MVYKSLSLTSGFPVLDQVQFDLRGIDIDLTCLTLGLMSYIYIFDGMFLEKMWATTFRMQYEGVGYMSCLLHFSAPALYGTIIKYVYDYGIQLNMWLLIVAFLQFLIGYITYRGSNNQKDAFRKNPYSPLLARK